MPPRFPPKHCQLHQVGGVRSEQDIDIAQTFIASAFSGKAMDYQIGINKRLEPCFTGALQWCVLCGMRCNVTLARLAEESSISSSSEGHCVALVKFDLLHNPCSACDNGLQTTSTEFSKSLTPDLHLLFAVHLTAYSSLEPRQPFTDPRQWPHLATASIHLSNFRLWLNRLDCWNGLAKRWLLTRMGASLPFQALQRSELGVEDLKMSVQIPGGPYVIEVSICERDADN